MDAPPLKTGYVADAWFLLPTLPMLPMLPLLLLVLDVVESCGAVIELPGNSAISRSVGGAKTPSIGDSSVTTAVVVIELE